MPEGGRWTEPPQVDARPGGRYRLTVEHEGKRYCIYGTYREVKPPERLVFTWQWDDDPNHHESGDTLVTIELFDRGGQTELVLTHTGFADEKWREEHARGWEGCLEEIARIVGG